MKFGQRPFDRSKQSTDDTKEQTEWRWIKRHTLRASLLVRPARLYNNVTQPSLDTSMYSREKLWSHRNMTSMIKIEGQ
jgi:hypothetical protein